MIKVSLSSLFLSCLRVESYKVYFLNLFSLCLLDMNMRRSTIRRKEGGVSNEGITPRIGQVPVVGLEEYNEEVPLQEPQVPPKPQDLQVPLMT